MLATLPQLKSFLGITTTDDDTQWLSCLAAADAAVKKYLHWNPEQTVGIVKFLDGTGVAELVMPGLPVSLAVSEVRVDINGGYGQVPNSFGDDTILVLGVNYLVDAENGILRMYLMPQLGWWLFPQGNQLGPTIYWGGLSRSGVVPAYWPRIPGSVKVTYTNGYSSIPADLQMATCQLAAAIFRNSPLGGNLMATSDSYIDVTESYSQIQVEAYGLLQLPALGTTRQLLAAYREPVIAGGIR